MEETRAFTQEIPEEAGSLGSSLDVSDGFLDFHGLTGSVGQTASETPADQLLGQMEQKTAIALTEDQSFARGQSPNLVVDSLIQCDDQSDPGAVQNGSPGVHRCVKRRMGSSYDRQDDIWDVASI